jgi:acyl-CoA synthetase (NDP forming)
MTSDPREKTREQIRRLLAPASIAIVGASADLERFNGRVVKNLLRHGYPGKVYPVNPKYDEVAGLPCYASVGDLPEIPETVFISVGRERVLDVFRKCAALGTPTATIYSAGFSEFDEEGGRIEAEIARIASDAGMRVCGPNTAGYHNFGGRVQLAGIIAMEVERVVPGAVGVICQSGSIGGALISRATHRGIGFSYLISCGNEMDLEMADYVDFLAADADTRSIAIYLEGLKNPGKFMAAAQRALEAGKPVVVCKVGRTSAGRAAAVSHTGALVGEDRAYGAAFHQLGITRVDGLEELLEVAQMFATTPLPRGRQVGVLTTSGGAGALVADECGGLGLELPPFGDELKARILETLPDFIGVSNPIDTTIAGINSFQEILRVLLDEAGFDILIAVVGSSAQFRHAIAVDPLVRAKEGGLSRDIPLLAYFNPYSEEAHLKMAAAGIPSFNTTEGAARAAGHLSRYAEFSRRRKIEGPLLRPEEIPAEARKILSGAFDTEGTGSGALSPVETSGSRAIGEAEGLALAEAFGIRAVPRRLCPGVEEVITAAGELGYPVVLKVSSPEVSHKTELGLVSEGLSDEASLRAAFSSLSENLRRANLKEVDGYLVQRLIRGGEEFLVGMVRDPQFGALITAGVGGAAAEAMGDVSVRLAPVSLTEADAMLNELRGTRLLDAFRGRGPLDRNALIEVIHRFSSLVACLGERLDEADLNPVFVLPEGEGVWAADALFVLSGSESVEIR